VKRSLLLAASFVASLALAQPASAQFRPNIWGSNSSNNLDIQKQRSALMAQRQKYAAPAKPRSAPKPPGLSLGTPGPYGRVDLSGRPVAGYATIRDIKSPIFGPPRHSAATRATARTHAPRALASPRAISPTPRVPPARRIPPPPPIP